MEKPIELSEVETAAVAGGILNNIFVNTAPVNQSFNTGSFNVASNNTTNSFNPNILNSILNSLNS